LTAQSHRIGEELKTALGRGTKTDHCLSRKKMATAAAPAAPQPFSPQEHARFVEGVEQYCRAHAGQVGGDACWAAIASHVQNRSADELKAHAQYYLMSLQSRSPELARAPTPVVWTSEENAYFEAQLAVVDEGSPERFAAIASGLPDKSEDDVRAWYEKLLGDLLEIERGARA